jgi:hypothetical protein
MPSMTRVMKTRRNGSGSSSMAQLDDVLDFSLGHGFFRVLGSGEGKLDDLRLQHALRQRGPFDARALAAQPAERLVHGDARQPGRQAGLAAKLLEMRKRADIGLLHHVLGLGIVAQHAAGDPVEPAVIRSA